MNSQRNAPDQNIAAMPHASSLSLTARLTRGPGRRSFLKALGFAGAGVAASLGIVPSAAASVWSSAAQSGAGASGQSGSPFAAAAAEARRRSKLTRGDADILRFLVAAELVETDLWQQYAELALNNAPFRTALNNLDEDMTQYVSDNFDDELSHAEFLNAYLISQGERPLNLDAFRTLPSSPASGAAQIGRLTNLTALTVDTSWWIRYRSTGNPDFGDTFPQLINIVNRTAIPLRDNYTADEIQAIANTAAFHFAFIEQGGSSLYTTLLPQAHARDSVRILAGIGGVEVNHFAVWHDKAGNAPAVSVPGLVFPDLDSFNGDELRQKDLIFPEPCKFISTGLPLCSVIRPGTTRNSGAVASATAFINDGLFIGQPPAFFRALRTLAVAADQARREDG